MNARYVSVLAETPVLVAIDIILSNNLSGLPVVDKTGVLIGILTKYDLIVQRSSINDDTKVRDVMNTDPLTLSEDNSVDEAIQAFAEHHKVDPIPVINSSHKITGVVSRSDMVKLFREFGVMPALGGNSIPAKKETSGLGWIILLTIATVAVLFYYFQIPIQFIWG